MLLVDLRTLAAKVSEIEAELAAEEKWIEELLSPVEKDGELCFSTPADGYWKKCWQLRNKADAARELLEAVKIATGKTL